MSTVARFTLPCGGCGKKREPSAPGERSNAEPGYCGPECPGIVDAMGAFVKGRGRFYDRTLALAAWAISRQLDHAPASVMVVRRRDRSFDVYLRYGRTVEKLECVL